MTIIFIIPKYTIFRTDGTELASTDVQCDPQTGQCVHKKTGEQIELLPNQLIQIKVDKTIVKLTDGSAIQWYYIQSIYHKETNTVSYERTDTNEPITILEYPYFVVLDQLVSRVQGIFQKYQGSFINIMKVSEKGYDGLFYHVRVDEQIQSVPFTHLQLTEIKYIGDGLTHLFFSKSGSSDLFQIV